MSDQLPTLPNNTDLSDRLLFAFSRASPQELIRNTMLGAILQSLVFGILAFNVSLPSGLGGETRMTDPSRHI